MKREQIKELVPEITKEALDAIMAENGRDVEAAKAKYADYEAVKQQLAEANKAIEDFKGLDVDGIRRAADEWKQKAEQAQQDAEAKIAALQFDRLLDDAIATAKGRNGKAIKALLDVETLRTSHNQAADVQAALETVKGENDYLFEAETKPVPAFGGPTPGPKAPDGLDAIRAAAGLKPKE